MSSVFVPRGLLLTALLASRSDGAALVLSGGGAKGAWEVGALEAICTGNVTGGFLQLILVIIVAFVIATLSLQLRKYVTLSGALKAKTNDELVRGVYRNYDSAEDDDG